MPVGVYGGRRDIMELAAPLGPVYQAGTLSGNPAAMAAGIETLLILKEDPGIYGRIEKKARQIADEVRKAAKGSVCVNQVGSLLSVFFTDAAVRDYESAVLSDTRRFADYFGYLLERGIYTAPSQFEAMFVSDAHTDEEIAYTCRVMREMKW